MANHMGQMWINDYFVELVSQDQWHQMKQCHICQEIMNHGQQMMETMLWFQILMR
jgi:hypothetical protein